MARELPPVYRPAPGFFPDPGPETPPPPPTPPPATDPEMDAIVARYLHPAPGPLEQAGELLGRAGETVGGVIGNIGRQPMPAAYAHDPEAYAADVAAGIPLSRPPGLPRPYSDPSPWAQGVEWEQGQPAEPEPQRARQELQEYYRQSAPGLPEWARRGIGRYSVVSNLDTLLSGREWQDPEGYTPTILDEAGGMLAGAAADAAMIGPLGAVTGLSRLGTGTAEVIGRGLPRLAGPLAERVLATGTEGAIYGGLQGAAESANAVRRGEESLAGAAGRTALGAVGGAAVGGALGGALYGGSRLLGRTPGPAARAAPALGEEGARLRGTGIAATEQAERPLRFLQPEPRSPTPETVPGIGAPASRVSLPPPSGRVLARIGGGAVAEAAPAPAAPTSRNVVNSILLDMYTKERPGETLPAVARLEGLRRTLVRQWTDRGIDLAELQKDVARRTGRPLGADEMVAELTRLNPDKAAEVRVDEGLRPAIQAVGEDLPWLSTYLTHMDNLDVAKAMGERVKAEVLAQDIPKTVVDSDLARARSRLQALQNFRGSDPDISQKLADAQKEITRLERKAGRRLAKAKVQQQAEAVSKGQQAMLKRQFSGKLQVQDSIDALADMQQELGPARMQRLEAAAEQVWGFADTLRQRAVQAGLWSRELADTLRQRYPHYVPTRILDYMENPMRIPRGRSLSVTDQGLRANSIEGTVRDREDPLGSMVRAAYQMESLARRNEAFNALVKLIERDPELQRVIREVPDGFKITNQQSKVSGFVAGERRTYVMPREIGVMLEQQAVSPVPAVDAAMSVFRALLTSHNPLFLASNATLDAATYAVRESSRAGGVQYLPQVLLELGRAYADAFAGLTSGQYRGETARFLRAGGGMFGYFSAEPGAVKRSVQGLQRGTALEVQGAKDLKRIVGDLLTLKPVAAIGERIELAPRVASYRLAERRGANQVQAVINGRTVTIDFAQGGTVAKFINHFVPFFNVGMQAMVQPKRAFRENPAGFINTGVALLAGPVIAAEAWNRSDPQRSRDYDDVPDYLKDQGVVIMLPGEAPVDARGNRQPQFVHIRLREYAPFAIWTRAAVQKAIGQDTRGWQELIATTAGQMSPIQANDIGGMVGGIVPPGVSTGLELYANKDFYRGATIATQRRDEEANPISQAIAPAIGARPSQVEYAIRDLTGGVGGMVLGGAEMAAGTTRGGNVPQQAPGVGGLLGRFVRGNTGQRMEEARNARLSPESRAILKEAGISDVSPVATDIGMGGGRRLKLLRAEETALQERTNELLNAQLGTLAADPRYRALPDEQKQRLLQQVMERARTQARNEMLGRIGNAELGRRLTPAGAR